MATPAQIEANRRNAQKSTGPRSVEGKASSRLNALKTGIDARSTVIRGEDPDALETLAADYYERFRPATPDQCFFVDALVQADWLLRRLRKIEAQLWESEFADAEQWHRFRKKCPLGDAFCRAGNAFNRLQRRIDSTERSYHRALNELRRLQAAAPSPAPPPLPDCAGPFAVEPEPPAPASEIGFVPSPHASAARLPRLVVGRPFRAAAGLLPGVLCA
jgi:hypothetical protein